MKSMIHFMKDIFKMKPGVLVWLFFLSTSNIFIPLFFLNHRAAQVMVASSLMGAMIGAWVHSKQGLTRLTGLMHAPWLISLYFLWVDWCATTANNLYGIWIRVALALTIVSLIIDGIDVVRYARGDRSRIVH